MAALNLPKLSNEELCAEINRGARFVQFDYNISFIILTVTLRSPIYYVPPGQSRAALGLRYSLITLFLGWWALPRGPIYTCITLFTNFRGGRDLTDLVVRNSPLGDILLAPKAGAPGAVGADPAQAEAQAEALAQVRERWPEGRRGGVPEAGPSTGKGATPAGWQPAPEAPPPTSILALVSVFLGVSALMVPCFYWSGIVGAFAVLAGMLALKATGGPKPERSGRNIAYVGMGSAVAGIVVSGLIFILYTVISSDTYHEWSARNHREPTFMAADKTIDTYGSDSYHGNCETAEALAAAYGRMIEADAPLALPPLKDADFTKTPFLVYCHLTDDICLFLVHVPKLESFQGEELERLHALAWQAGGRTIAGEPLRLIIATRGESAVYQSKLYGDASADMPQVTPAAKEQILEPLFRTTKPTRSFAFDILVPDAVEAPAGPATPAAPEAEPIAVP